MTPSFIGLIATMLPGVRPSISLASFPTASTRPLILLIATIDGSLTTMPLPRAYTHVLAVPWSIARSLENSESIQRRLTRELLGDGGPASRSCWAWLGSPGHDAGRTRRLPGRELSRSRGGGDETRSP